MDGGALRRAVLTGWNETSMTIVCQTPRPHIVSISSLIHYELFTWIFEEKLALDQTLVRDGHLLHPKTGG